MLLNKIKRLGAICKFKDAFSINRVASFHNNITLLKDKSDEGNIDLTNSIKIKDLDWISTKINNKSKPLKKEFVKKVEKKDANKNKWAKIERQDDYIKSETINEDQDIPHWKLRKQEINKKFGGEQWNPTKRISRTAMERIRFLAKELPHDWPLLKISEEFKIAPEAVRRILKSKFQPSQSVIEHQENKRREKRMEFLKSIKEIDGSDKNVKEKRISNRDGSKMKRMPLEGVKTGWESL
ncbi:hypothetical protein K502DRAFT_361692 [Neoconidiobolus thromboides FSU 785]|nr:hypothetical protein K502DRAFT_361692 [Neoconidiobolus thromboides FSU 785]